MASHGHGSSGVPADGHASQAVTHDDHGHPSPRQYIIIAVILAVITLVEVAIFYFEFPRVVLITSLLLLSLVKFVLVVMYYMHLKFDSRIITGVFGFALLIGLTVATAFIALFHGISF